ncbi:unnamed protein product, partial [Cyprideis torosa]
MVPLCTGIRTKFFLAFSTALDLALGYSHNILLQLPKEIQVETQSEKGKNPIIILKSHDKQLLGMVAAKIRSMRKIEPYKGKGVKFVGEYVRRKAGAGLSGSKTEVAKEVGLKIAELAKSKGIEKLNMLDLKNIEKVKPGGIELIDRLVGVQRVTKVTKGGRAFGFSAIVVVGDEAGVVGYGLGKSKDVSTAISKAVENAKKNLVRIPVHKGTIPHEQSSRYGGASVFIRPASSGTGVIAGGAMRAVLESVGVHDVLAKSKGSSNPHNVVKATFKALLSLRSPEDIARQR